MNSQLSYLVNEERMLNAWDRKSNSSEQMWGSSSLVVQKRWEYKDKEAQDTHKKPDWNVYVEGIPGKGSKAGNSYRLEQGDKDRL